jgi:hypothetical protein
MSNGIAPRFEIERLILRETRAEDFDAGVGLWADARVVRHISGTPFESWGRMLRFPAFGRCWAMVTGRWKMPILGSFAAKWGLQTSSVTSPSTSTACGKPAGC